MYSAYYSHIIKCEKIGERDVKFTFDGPGNRELPLIVGRGDGVPEALVGRDRLAGPQARHLPRPRWSRRWDPAPIASRSSSRDGRWCSNACTDYWGKNQPKDIGQNNFDQMRYEYFRDDTVAREAFKADQVDWIAEHSAKKWSTPTIFRPCAKTA